MTHRGQQIRDALLSRSQQRGSRRARHTRYRPARFRNRRRSAGWLPPSLKSRIDNIWTWAVRLAWRCPITSISQELVRFDMQLMENAEISDIEYQQGVLKATRCVSICLKSGAASVLTVGRRTCLSKLSISLLRHAVDQIASRTCLSPATIAIRKKAHRPPLSLDIQRFRRKPGSLSRMLPL